MSAVKGLVRFFTNPLIGFVIFLGAGLWAANRYVPPQHLPWKPLDLSRPMGLATGSQLFALQMAPRSQCKAAMETQLPDLNFVIEPPRESEKGCGWELGINMGSVHGVNFSPPEVMNICPMAAANTLWIREINLRAEEILGQKIKTILHYDTYSCRTIAGSSRLSEHAFANAWDVSGFILADGSRVSVLKDWDVAGPKAEFLRAARDEACGIYRVTLSPDYNAAHKDHFHIDMGPSRSCR